MRIQTFAADICSRKLWIIVSATYDSANHRHDRQLRCEEFLPGKKAKSLWVLCLTEIGTARNCSASSIVAVKTVLIVTVLSAGRANPKRAHLVIKRAFAGVQFFGDGPAG